MAEPNQAQQTRHVAIVLLPQFSLLGFGAAIDPLRAANGLAGARLYEWRVLSVDGEPVEASNGIAVLPHEKIGDVTWPNLALVHGGFDVDRYASPPLLAWLRSLARRRVDIGSLSTGSVVLARAGLLNGYRCTVHWENYESFLEQFPDVLATESVYEIDRDRFTCSGGTAALDMMLAIIARDHGEDLATSVSEQFIHDRIRTQSDNQKNIEMRMLMRRSPKLAAAIRLMIDNLEVPLPSTEIAVRLGLSLRQVERLFRKYNGSTLRQYYLALRLKRARQLLLQTDLSVLEVAVATGFSSHSHFTKCYRTMFACTPTRHRLRGELA